MQPEEFVRDLLMMEFIGLQAKNPRYSMRSYSSKVGIPQSAISEIIGKQRKVTAKMAHKILIGLAVPEQTIAEVLQNYKKQRSETATSTHPSNGNFQALSMDQFHTVSEWYHFAILSLAETKTFKSSPAWIAKRLGVSQVQAETAIARLLRLEMLQMDPKTKKLKPTGVQYQIDPGVATAALKKACRENMELSAKALETTNFEERDFTAITFCFNPDKMSEAKRLIKSFRSKFSQQMETSEKKEVYKLCIQLFPLSKNGDEQ